MQSTKLTYFTTTERGTATENSIKFPFFLTTSDRKQAEKLLVSVLNSWVNRKAGKHDFPSIKVTLSSELKRVRVGAKQKLQCSFLKSRKGRRFFVIPLES